MDKQDRQDGESRFVTIILIVVVSLIFSTLVRNW